MATVLLVEDSENARSYVAEQLRKKGYVVFEAEFLVDAKATLRSEGPFDLISWDGQLRDGFSYGGTIQEVQKTFTGPMIAASKDADVRALQMQAGCTHEADFQPRHFNRDLVALIAQLVPQPPPPSP